jgi:AbrB family looped-hinge helix DNA binding protein
MAGSVNRKKKINILGAPVLPGCYDLILPSDCTPSALLIFRITDIQSGEIMNNTFQVQVVKRGIITLPKELREHNNIEEGDRVTLIDLGDGVVVMSHKRSRVDEIADKLAWEWQESGETLETMLATLREVRAEYAAKKS